MPYIWSDDKTRILLRYVEKQKGERSLFLSKKNEAYSEVVRLIKQLDPQDQIQPMQVTRKAYGIFRYHHRRQFSTVDDLFRNGCKVLQYDYCQDMLRQTDMYDENDDEPEINDQLVNQPCELDNANCDQTKLSHTSSSQQSECGYDTERSAVVFEENPIIRTPSYSPIEQSATTGFLVEAPQADEISHPSPWNQKRLANKDKQRNSLGKSHVDHPDTDIDLFLFKDPQSFVPSKKRLENDKDTILREIRSSVRHVLLTAVGRNADTFAPNANFDKQPVLLEALDSMQFLDICLPVIGGFSKWEVSRRFSVSVISMENFLQALLGSCIWGGSLEGILASLPLDPDCRERKDEVSLIYEDTIRSCELFRTSK